MMKNLAPLPVIGAQASRAHTVTEADIVQFADVSGDHNPIHLDAQYAARSSFGQRIAHGFLSGSYISAVVGMDLPGPGSIYVGQTLRFLAPVHIGDTVTARAEVIALREEKRLVTLRTDCINQDGVVVLTGEAVIKYMREAEVSSDK
ncbi:MAG: MaoC family dehydratase [Ktedonobacteraceae bacterium]